MNKAFQQTINKFFILIFAFLIMGFSLFQIRAAELSTTISSKLNSLTNNTNVVITIVAFNTNEGLGENHLDMLSTVGINIGYKFNTLGMVASPITIGQIRTLNDNPNVRFIWANDKLQYFMHEAKVVTDVNKLTFDSGLTTRNRGLPVSGKGDFDAIAVYVTNAGSTNSDKVGKYFERKILKYISSFH